MAVHESQESWEQFRDEILMPKMQAGIDGGFPTPPRTAIDLYTGPCPSDTARPTSGARTAHRERSLERP